MLFQLLNVIRRSVPPGTSFAKCVLELDFAEGGEGVSVLSGKVGLGRTWGQMMR